MLKLGFKGHVQPKLEERLNDVAKDLRMTLQIAEGDSQEEIIKKEALFQSATTNQEFDDLYKKKVPLHQQVKLLKLQIEKIKKILEKSKEIKEELKMDILIENDKIDKYIEKLGKDFVIDSLYKNQTHSVNLMEQRLENLKLQKEQ